MKNDAYFEVALMEKPGTEGLTMENVMDLHDMLSRPEGYPVVIKAVNKDSTAMGFITPQAAKELRYEYGQHSNLGLIVSRILSDKEKESEDGTYTYKTLSKACLRIYIGR